MDWFEIVDKTAEYRRRAKESEGLNIEHTTEEVDGITYNVTLVNGVEVAREAHIEETESSVPLQG